LQSTISQLQQQLANDKQAAQSAQQMLESAQQNFDHATAAQKAAEEKVSQTKAALSNAQQAVTTAKANAQAAQQKVADAKEAALNALEAYNNYKNNNGVPTIKTPTDIVQQYENYLNGKRYNGAQIKADCLEGLKLNGADPTKGLMGAGWTSKDGGKTWIPILQVDYQATEKDNNETVNPRNMTAEQQADVTEFAAQVINAFRESFQSTPAGAAHSYGKVKVSPYATQLGNKVIDGAYNNSGWNKSNNPTGSPHNEAGMIEAANNAGLTTGFVGENLSTGLLLDPTAVQIKQAMTMAQVKKSIYAGILAMIYQDVETNDGDKLHLGFGGHTEAFLNDPKGMNGISFDDNGTQYMTVTIDKDGWVHYNFFDDGQSSQAMKDKLAQNATTPENISATKINQAHNEYMQKEASVTTAKNAANAAQGGIITAQANLATAQTAVDNAATAQQTAASETSKQKAILANAQAAVNLANENISKLQAKLEQTQAELSAINGNVQEQAHQLAQAQANLDAAQQKLAASKNSQSESNTAVQNANTKLQQLQQTVQAKQAELQKAQGELQNKKTEYAQMNDQMRVARVFGASLAAVSPQSKYEKAINEAKQAVATAQQKLSDDTQTYNDSQAKLQELVAKANQQKTIYQATLANAKKSDAVQNDVAVKKAKSALQSAQLKVQVETGKLTQLKGTLSKDQANLDQANGDLTKAQEKLTDLQSALKRAQITLDALSHPAVPETPVAHETTTENHEATASSEASTSATSQSQENTTSAAENETSQAADQEETVLNVENTQPAQQVLTNKVQNPSALNRASEESSIKSEIAAQIAARNAHAANDNMMAGFDDPYDNYYDQQQEAASIPSAPFEGYTRQLRNSSMINAKLEAAIKSGQIKLPSSNTKAEAKKQPKVNKDSLTAMTVVAAGAALATGASLNKKRKNRVAKRLADKQ
jgi:SEC10/PgrA surface exclusion-like protein